MSSFSFFHSSQWLRCSARFRYLKKGRGRPGRERNDSLTIPSGAAWEYRIRESNRRSANQSNFFHLRVRKKSKPLAVGRKERIDGTFATGNRPGLQAV